jgi:TonB-linked SusC/RagA family outer membrane protein
MKHPYLVKLRFLLFVLLGLTASLGAWAQAGTGTVNGRVTDAKNEGIPGVTVLVDGTSVGGSTNADGTYTISGVPAGARTLVISFVGYSTVRQPVTVVAGQTATVPAQRMSENATALGEAVVVGYGTQRRQDLTGAVDQVDSKRFVQGQVTNPEQLIQGKVAGVQITTGGGAPGTGTQIRIRGGSSLNASNDPLIVIDGVPVDNTNINGGTNPLAQINPNDIASITVLKDASSTAIYGVRASNGVIIVTTKRGIIGEPTHVNVSTQLSIGTVAKYNDILSADQFRSLVGSIGTPGQVQALGTANTNWQKQIFRNAFSADNNVSVSGAAGKLPYRASVGYLNQEGLLRNNNLKRYTGSVNLNPVLLDGNLRINLNVRGSLIDNNFGPSDQGSAIGNALFFDPTQPVHSSDPNLAKYGGYYQVLNSDGTTNTLAPLNPVAQIEQTRNRSTVMRSIGNIQLDYKLPFLKGLSANLNMGYDVQHSNGTVNQPLTSAEAARGQGANRGTNNSYQQGLSNHLLEAYGKYENTIGPGRLELLAGYSFQRFQNNFYSQPNYALDGTTIVTAETPANRVTGASSAKAVNVLLSYYGRLNYNIADKYLFTGTIRRDATSRFDGPFRVGYFPSGAFAWRIKGEDFLKDSKTLSDLKLRIGYGQTGQQDLGSGNFYPYISGFTLSGQTSQYQIGYNADGSPRFVQTLRPDAFNPNITWETTTTYNLGLDYGFADGRIYGSIDVYQRDTKNLLNFTNIQVGGGISNAGNYNIGSLTNKGVEAALNFELVKSDRLNITVNTNATYNQNRLTKLTLSDSPNDVGTLAGGIAGGNGNTIQVQTVGYPTNTFYVYQQVYGQDGRPLQGVYVDRNGDGTINSSDLYRYKSPRPNVTLGGGANINYRGINLAFSLRANLGNYVYNNVRSQAYYDQSTAGFIVNRNADILNTGFTAAQYLSDYYVQNASFLRMDNATLGYNLGTFFKKGTNLNLSLAVQNVFVVTKYKGIDPEIASGIDNTFYPRPRTFTVGLNFGI